MLSLSRSMQIGTLVLLVASSGCAPAHTPATVLQSSTDAQADAPYLTNTSPVPITPVPADVSSVPAAPLDEVSPITTEGWIVYENAAHRFSLGHPPGFGVPSSDASTGLIGGQIAFSPDLVYQRLMRYCTPAVAGQLAEQPVLRGGQPYLLAAQDYFLGLEIDDQSAVCDGHAPGHIIGI